MPFLIDGNNLLHSLPLPAASRGDVRRAVLDACRHERMRATVVFDGPPPDGTPSRESLGSITVVYSGSKTADDVIIHQLPQGKETRDWIVVTDDRQLRERVKNLGAAVQALREWQGRKRRPASRRRTEPKLSSHEVAEWEAFFSDKREEEE
jgi:predicted RNA-binding protein with PIN domain